MSTKAGRGRFARTDPALDQVASAHSQLFLHFPFGSFLHGEGVGLGKGVGVGDGVGVGVGVALGEGDGVGVGLGCAFATVKVTTAESPAFPAASHALTYST